MTRRQPEGGWRIWGGGPAIVPLPPGTGLALPPNSARVGSFPHPTSRSHAQALGVSYR